MKQLVEQGYSNVIGYDTSSAMIGRGRTEHPDLDLNAYSGPAVAEQNCSFDAIVCCALLTSLPVATERETVILEMARVLRPGGAVHVSEFMTDPRRCYRPGGTFVSTLGIEMKHYEIAELTQMLASFACDSVRQVDANSLSGASAPAIHFFGRKPSSTPNTQNGGNGNRP
jgi:ubiquinone/menaquinone biosynthesis C-methylase UbiE